MAMALKHIACHRRWNLPLSLLELPPRLQTAVTTTALPTGPPSEHSQRGPHALHPFGGLAR
jgi:hypothetical protein